MEGVSNVAELIGRVLVFLVVAFVTTVVVSMGSGFCSASPVHSGASLASLP